MASNSRFSVEQSSAPTPVRSAPALEVDGPRLSSAVLFVHDLDASVAFYSEVLKMVVTIRDPSAALLVNASSQLYLRQMGQRAPHILGAIGVQYVIWTASSSEDLHRIERVLEGRCSQVTRHVVDGISFIEGKDPSGVPVVVTYPGPDQAARRAIMQRVYSW